jgi:signal peptidase II
MKFIFLISLPLYALDQLTKAYVILSIRPEEPWKIIPGFFDLVHITNTGAAFGSFRDNNTFFVGLSILALIFVVILLVRRHRSPDPWRDVSLALLLAGVLGNLTDRLLHGHVIDFLLFDFGSHVPQFLHPWPAFNVADSCICIAVVFFVIHSFWQSKRGAAPQNTVNTGFYPGSDKTKDIEVFKGFNCIVRHAVEAALCEMRRPHRAIALC